MSLKIYVKWKKQNIVIFLHSSTYINFEQGSSKGTEHTLVVVYGIEENGGDWWETAGFL